MMDKKIYIENFFSDLELFGIKLGLTQTIELFARIGSPEKKLRFIHIAGTNGKGSTGGMITAALTKSGFKTAFYSSPHLINVRERFRINGRAISESELADEIAFIEPHICEMRRNHVSPTYFEVTTAVAAAYFARNSVDFVIWETGMGGRFDATNIVTPELSVITGIALDHTVHLGESIEKIAFEKAGIIKKNRPVFCGELPENAKKIITETAQTTHSECYFYEPDNHHQYAETTYLQKNTELAEKIIDFLSVKFNFSRNRALNGMKKLRWPGRMQILNNHTIIDGAHNSQAAEALVKSLKLLYPERKYSIIFASMKDKETIKVLKILARIAEEFIFPEFQCSRGAVETEKLKELAESIPGLKLKETSNFREAFALSGTYTLITGSLYLAGEALKELGYENEVLNIL